MWKNELTLTFVSDTHEQEYKIAPIEPTFVLIHTGDAVNKGQMTKLAIFLDWMAKQPACYKIWVPGNHDRLAIQKHEATVRQMCFQRGITILLHEHFSIPEPFITFYGAPLLGGKSDKDSRTYPGLPESVDILLSHEPPYGILDKVFREPREGECLSGHIGNKRLLDCKSVIHAMGHVHEGYGSVVKDGTLYLNNSLCERGTGLLINKPQIAELTKYFGGWSCRQIQ